MARKTTGNTPTNRGKKTGASFPPAAVQVAPEVGKEARKNTKPASPVPGNIEDEIRRRAYEFYLQRRAAGGGENGGENEDWLLAEREVRSRYGRHERRTA